MDPQTGPHESPSNLLTPLNSPSTPNSLISPDSSSTISSSTGGGAPKWYRLVSDLYEAIEQLMMVQDIEEPSTYQEAKDKVEWVDAMKA